MMTHMMHLFKSNSITHYVVIAPAIHEQCSFSIRSFKRPSWFAKELMNISQCQRIIYTSIQMQVVSNFAIILTSFSSHQCPTVNIKVVHSLSSSIQNLWTRLHQRTLHPHTVCYNPNAPMWLSYKPTEKAVYSTNNVLSCLARSFRPISVEFSDGRVICDCRKYVFEMREWSGCVGRNR